MIGVFTVSGRMVSALLIGLVLLGFGVVSVSAQEATPVTGVTSTPPPEMATMPDPSDDPMEPEARPAAHMQSTQRESPSVSAQQATGTVDVTIQDGNLDPVTGACVLIESQDGTSSYQCDGREDGVADGNMRFTLPPGGYNLVVARAPVGYISGTNVPFSLGAGLTVNVTIDLQPGGRAVFVTTVDENDHPVSEACFSIFTELEFGQRGEQVSSSCAPPPADPDDGTAYFPGIAPGSYIAVQTRVPTGHVLAADTPFRVPASGTGPIIVTVISPTLDLAGDLIVNKVDEHGDPLAGACFAVHEDAGGGQRGDVIVQRCNSEDGQLVFTGLAPGAYVLAEYHAPDGYVSGGQRQVTISADAPTTITVPNAPGGSDITVRTVDPETGALLTGACFAIHRDDGSGQAAAGTFLVGRCDHSDGATNGITLFTGLASGDYILVENQAPQGYKAISEIVLLSVDGTADTTITVENVPLTLAEQIVMVLKEILRRILG